MKKLARILIYSIPFLFLYTPAWLPYPHVTFKALAFRAIVFLVFLIYIIFLFFKNKEKTNNFPMIEFLFGGILLAIGFSNFLNGPTPVSFFGTIVRMGGFIDTVFLLTYCYLLTQIFEWENYITYFKCWLLSSIYVFSFNLLYLLGHPGERVAMIYGNPIHVGVFAMFMFFISTFLYFEEKKKIYIMFMLINSILVFMTQTKSVMLGFLVGVIFISIYVLNSAYNRLQI
ncbi:MAG: hypothetical protein V4547_17270 [Bacteroidota bacterium]